MQAWSYKLSCDTDTVKHPIPEHIILFEHLLPEMVDRESTGQFGTTRVARESTFPSVAVQS